MFKPRESLKGDREERLAVEALRIATHEVARMRAPESRHFANVGFGETVVCDFTPGAGRSVGVDLASEHSASCGPY